ncbi:YwiC-like family protein [Corynebacterium anserum]|uniref:YwiC-like protein n=1 Tax=Corynebacterium anserum TaxID=2684406 RepID=A0A7G7YML5_9CORY|nr:YwiC-like family protein [Corynebacterium anserum]QNH95735.1 hypothetical protein GP473_02740 [Corynebacterium anserum]
MSRQPTSPVTSSKSSHRERPGTSTRRRKRQSRGNAWVPNQHGAWAMLIMPMFVGVILGLLLSPAAPGTPERFKVYALMAAIAVMWLFGYFAFYAFGLWHKTRSKQRKKEYRAPLVVYGAITVIAGLSALAMNWQMLWWVPIFLPLVVWAFVEVIRRHPRSLSSGVSTTVASSLMIPVMVSAAVQGPPGFFFYAPAQLIIATLCVALYFVGTIPYVKTLIREKGNPSYVKFSVIYHFIALIVVSIMCVPLLILGVFWPSALIFILTMAWCLYRAWRVPALAANNPRAWTPKRVGMREIWPTLTLAVGCVAIAFF